MKPSMTKRKNNTIRETDGQRGQSFVELSLVIIFLMIFLAGVVEFGFLLNNYLNLVDASREAVRYSSNFDPFLSGCDRSDPDCLDFQFFDDTAELTEEVLLPLELDPSAGDDVVISFFSVGGGVYERYPNQQGWSVYGQQKTKFSDAQIKENLNSSAPPTGILLVEIFYNYPQILKMPVFTLIVSDPIPVYVYAIMPLTAAEPAVTLTTEPNTPTSGPNTPTSEPNTPIPVPDTPTPEPTDEPFVCSVNASALSASGKKALAVDITNNSNQTLHYSEITFFFNSDSPSNQFLKNVRNDSTALWSGKAYSSLAGSFGGEVAPGATAQLKFSFNKNYSSTGVEQLILEFQETGCSTLDIR